MNGQYLVLFLCVLWGTMSSVKTVLADEQSMTVRGEINVFDGDTLEIGPLLIRLHGIDAPERGQSCVTQDRRMWKCGAAASNRVAELIGEQQISCHAIDRDPYGRIIAQCDVAGADIAATLIEEGLAWAFVEYSLDYVQLEALAKERGIGIWQAETQTPWSYRADKWNRALEASPDGKCPIKGNVSPAKSKSKIYHTPWSPNYSATKIDETKGEHWFCNEAEALAAGWRAVAGR